MQAKRKVADPARPTFTETARRAQIVRAAIETIAEVGYCRASFARIARRAGLSSTGLISYHFAAKDELIGQVVTETFSAIGQFMAERMRGPSTAAGALAAYIEGNAAFVAVHRTEMKALLEIFMNGGIHYDSGTELVVLSPIEQILSKFRDFDTRVMAAVIQRAVDGLPFLLEAHPDLDVGTYARELVTTFGLATRRSP